MTSSGAGWTGTWVARRLDVTVSDVPEPDATGAAAGPSVRDLVGLAVRRNPRRAHLLVSRVLGKHVPTDPRLVRAAGLLLGARVAEALGAGPAPDGGPERLRRALTGEGSARRARDGAAAATGALPDCVVLGYAETATGLAHSVADALDASFGLHSTRRRATGVPSLAGFSESHSHAAEHLLLPRDPDGLAGDAPLVLVDDELSTGRTAAATIRALHARIPRGCYLVAALVDVRDPGHDDLDAVARELGVRVDVTALARARVDWSERTAELGAALVAEVDRDAPPATSAAAPAPATAPVSSVRLDLPPGVPGSARHGMTRADRTALEAALPGCVDRLADALPEAPGRVLVLGTEELMYLPMRLAEGLADRAPEGTVDFSSTTRSPVLAVDDPGYAIRSVVRFGVHERGTAPGTRYAYNVAVGRYDTVVVVVDDAHHAAALRGPGGLVQALRRVAGRVVEATVPAAPVPGPTAPLRGPAFGSYPAADVGWMLTDLSSVPLEAPTPEREEAVRRGRAHYAESLPVEYQPGPEYRRLFADGLVRAAPRLAAAVARVTDDVLAATGPDTVLVSLARAGTPMGVLMRRWADRAHGLDLPHYTISIVRDRGIDTAALDAIATWHDPATVRFVDGWTGKGAIVDELRAALTGPHAGWDPTVAVLADPGYATGVHGTREDFLVPSACLNSTVSGLVSRTVLRSDLVPPGGYHGAKFYAGLAADDVSAVFLDAVTAHFPDAAPPPGTASPEPADRRGLRWVRALAARLGVRDLNLVKPGVGEATRVLLRRMPECVLLHPDAGADVEHVRLLAHDRGVPVRELPAELEGAPSPYRAVGVIGSGQ